MVVRQHACLALALGASMPNRATGHAIVFRTHQQHGTTYYKLHHGFGDITIDIKYALSTKVGSKP